LVWIEETLAAPSSFSLRKWWRASDE